MDVRWFIWLPTQNSIWTHPRLTFGWSTGEIVANPAWFGQITLVILSNRRVEPGQFTQVSAANGYASN